VEAFNKIFKQALTNICDVKIDDWDLRVPATLWANKKTCKNITGHTSFRRVYGQEVVVPMEYIVPSLRIATFTSMDDSNAEADRIRNYWRLMRINSL